MEKSIVWILAFSILTLSTSAFAQSGQSEQYSTITPPRLSEKQVVQASNDVVKAINGLTCTACAEAEEKFLIVDLAQISSVGVSFGSGQTYVTVIGKVQRGFLNSDGMTTSGGLPFGKQLYIRIPKECAEDARLVMSLGGSAKLSLSGSASELGSELKINSERSYSCSANRY